MIETSQITQEKQLPTEQLKLSNKAVGFDLGSSIELDMPVMTEQGKDKEVDLVLSLYNPYVNEKVVVFRTHGEQGQSNICVGILSPSESGWTAPVLRGEVMAREGSGKKGELISRQVLTGSKSVEIQIDPLKGTGTVEDLMWHAQRDKLEATIPERSQSALAAPKRFEKMVKESRRNPGKIRRAVGKVGLGAMLLTTPHGPLDMAMDAFTNQAAVVSDVGDKMAQDTPVKITAANDKRVDFKLRNDDTLDGDGLNMMGVEVVPGGNTYKVDEKRYDKHKSDGFYTDQQVAQHNNLSEKAQADINDLNKKYVDSIKLATDQVGRVLHAVDVGDTGYIKLKNDMLHATYGSELLTDKQIETTLSKIDSANTNQEVLLEFNNFLVKYGLEAHSSDGTDNNLPIKASNVKNIKAMSKDLVRLMSLFPTTKFGEAFKVRHIEFGDQVYDDNGLVSGYTEFIDNSTVYLTTGSFNNGIPFTRSNIATGATPEHEFGHTFKSVHLNKKWKKGLSPLEFEFGRLGNFKNHPSTYALTGGFDERNAEVMAELFEKGVVSPSRGLEFMSPDNEERIELMIRLEEIVPGISARFADRIKPLASNGNVLNSASKQATERKVLALLSMLLAYRNREKRVKVVRQSYVA